MTYRFKTRCSKSKLREVRSFVNKVLHEYAISEIEINKLILAVDEICANLIIHSHECNPKDSIELMIHVKENESITFEISDQGLGFNNNNYKEPSIQEIVQERRKGGIGLLLVKRIMDQVEFTNEDNQNICRLVKKLK
ncbi:MAG: ATP-binding protein [Bacteroidota bacterium]|nr:ATP-binding protein [Bacteroidota bacterium]